MPEAVNWVGSSLRHGIALALSHQSTMRFPRRLVLGWALLLGALSASPNAANQEGQGVEPTVALAAEASSNRLPPHSELFPTPAEGLTINSQEFTLEALVKDFQRVTGERLMYSLDTRQHLRSAEPTPPEQLVVPPEEVYSAFQAILIANRFVLTDLRRDEPRMMMLASLDSPARASLKDKAKYVPIERLHEYERDSALLVTTIVTLPHVGIRHFKNAMRDQIVDWNTKRVLHLPEHGQVILTSFGDDAVRTVAMLEELDARVAQDPEYQHQEQPDDALLEAAKILGLDGDK